MKSQVLIVGAGPTGLVLALCLARHGIRFRIIDKNSGPGQASRAMVVQARTLEFYQQLGIADEVVAQGIPVEEIHLCEKGKELVRFSFKNLGVDLSPFPFALCFPQDDHERFLVDKLKSAGITVEWGVELKSCSQDEGGVHAVLDKAGKQEACDVDYLCGCDGAHSTVRQGLNLNFSGGDYEQLFYVADVKIEGQFRKDLLINLGVKSLGLMFPVRSSGMQRLIGLIDPKFSHRTDIAFEDIRSSVESLLRIQVTQVNWFSSYHVHHRVADHFQAGRCFIAGDAAHIHSPAGGQGMNTGIGDAVNLSWKLAQVLKVKADTALLETYETERIAFARKLVTTTDKAFQAMVGQGLISQFLRTWLMPHLMPVLTRFSAVRRMIFTTVSQLHINYHKSALSMGIAGKVQGGKRLPWVVSPKGSNFGPLKSLHWHLHIYGKISPHFLEAASTLGLPVYDFDWNDAAKKAGLKRDAAYLLRPDGYVALAMPTQDTNSLKDFELKRNLSFK